MPNEQRRFAHGLIDCTGFDIIHGDSPHHPKAIEVHNGRLILYGCSDFVNDCEGIGFDLPFRDDLAVAYVARISSVSDASCCRSKSKIFTCSVSSLRISPGSYTCSIASAAGLGLGFRDGARLVLDWN